MANKRSREVAKHGDNTPEETPPALRWEKQMAGMDDAQRAEATAIQEREALRPRRVTMGLVDAKGGKALTVGGDDSSDAVKTLHSMRLFDAVGSSSFDFSSDFLRRLTETVRLTGDNKQDSERLSAAMALVGGISPQDEMEATMAIQMVAANEAALLFFERARTAQYMQHAAPYSNMANKAMRSFALHAEALAKLRRGGEQVVKHVHVNEGGQALIAGTVHTGGRG